MPAAARGYGRSGPNAGVSQGDGAVGRGGRGDGQYLSSALRKEILEPAHGSGVHFRQLRSLVGRVGQDNCPRRAVIVLRVCADRGGLPMPVAATS